MLIFDYNSKKELKENIGKRLIYIETSLFGEQYKPNGWLVGANRPHITKRGREFFANVQMKDGIIVEVK
jgi:hypothetical protein